MCETCGCGETDHVIIRKPGEQLDHPIEHDHGHEHSHSHDESHDHPHDHGQGVTIRLGRDILSKNDLLAAENRGYFDAKNIFAINLVSSPGSGKTTLLERTIREIGQEMSISIIEGDQQTMFDAERIDKTGVPVIQVNTGNGCHLDAHMVRHAVRSLEIPSGSLLMIENVGNLVCPALFDLGEASRVVIISVTEGEDKPAKYPNMFQSSQLCIINKTDLLPYVDFDVSKTKEYALRVNPELKFFELSARTGEGFSQWLEWLRSSVARKQ